MTTVREYLNQNGVHTNKNTNATDMVNSLSRIPSSVLILIPGLGTAIAALKMANTALSTAHSTYCTASKILSDCKQALDTYSAGKATSEGNPAGAAYVSQVSVKSLAKEALNSASGAVSSGLSSLKNTIEDTEVPGT